MFRTLFSSYFHFLSSTSYLTSKMVMVCGSCYKTIKTKSVTCDHCTQIYRPSCTTLKPVRNKSNKVINACRTVYLSQMQIVSSINENNSNDHFTVTNSTPESLSASCSNVPISSSDHLHQILEKLTKLETLDASLDNRFTEMQASFNTRFTEMQASFDTRFIEIQASFARVLLK